MMREPIDVGRRVKPAKIDELSDRLLAEPFDVERSTRDEVPEPFKSLRRADQSTSAADVDLTFLGNGITAALGTMVGELERWPRFGPGQIFHYLRDDVACPLDANPITDPESQACNFITVVKRDVRNNDTADS